MLSILGWASVGMLMSPALLCSTTGAMIILALISSSPALAGATGHRERAWGLFWLDQRWCAICLLMIIIIILSHVLEIWQPDLMLSALNQLHKTDFFPIWYEWILTPEGFGIGSKKGAFSVWVPLQSRWIFRGTEEDYPLLQIGNGTKTFE